MWRNCGKSSKSFGLRAIVVPDLSTSLDGHLDDLNYATTTTGGTPIADLKAIGQSAVTFVMGRSLMGAAEILAERFGTPAIPFDQLTGLEGVDRFLHILSKFSGYQVPQKYQRQRRRVQDAMLDTHFYFGRKQVAIAAEPDLLYNTAWWLQSTGVEIQAAVTATKSPLLKHLPTEKVYIGDFEDFEDLATGADLWIANSKVRPVARRHGIPLYLHGFPMLDQLGNGQRCTVGYRGTLDMLFAIGNVFLKADEERVHDLVHEWRDGGIDRTVHYPDVHPPFPVGAAFDPTLHKGEKFADPFMTCAGEAIANPQTFRLGRGLRRSDHLSPGRSRSVKPSTSRNPNDILAKTQIFPQIPPQIPKETPMKIAFTTKDSIYINAHFGSAKQIDIYDIDTEGYTLAESVTFGGNLEQDGNEDKLVPKFNALKDCTIVYLADIGPSAAARLINKNITPIKPTDPESPSPTCSIAWWSL
jgi:nitrogen fixation protein NifX